MSLPTAPGSLSFTDDANKVTTFELVNISADVATYRCTVLQDTNNFSLIEAPSLTITRRPANSGQTQRKYTLKAVFPVIDTLTGIKTGEWIYAVDSSRPANWRYPGISALPPLVNSENYLKALNSFISNDAFTTAICDETFVR